MIFDFSEYELSNISYGGSEKKLGILIKNEPYMLKFQKKTPFNLRFNHISEYLGCHIYELLGLKCQKTYLGYYNNQQVVACKDFVAEGFQFVPFNDVGESTIESNKEKYQYSYSDIIDLLNKNKKITNIDETISIFFDMFKIDAFIGNFDRHGANWGFLKRNNKYIIAPVFDNGSCLFSNLTNEDEMIFILNNQDELNKRILKFPTSQIKLSGRKSSYFEIISSLRYKECNEALTRIFPRINMNDIFNLIDNIELIFQIHKQFYKKILNERYEKIIKYSYNKLRGKSYE